MDAPIYNNEGKEAGKVTLPESIFGLSWNADLVHQVVLTLRANARANTAHTKDRSEVRGGGKKPWRQKGLGRARHGSRRSPIWRGGGITFGPRNDRDYSQKANQKARTKALFTVLSQKLRDGEIVFVEDLSFEGPKAKDAKSILETLEKNFEGINKKKNAAIVLLPKWDENTYLSFRNFGNVGVDEVRNLNTLEALSAKYLVVVNPDQAVAELTKREEAASLVGDKKEAKKTTKKEKVTA